MPQLMFKHHWARQCIIQNVTESACDVTDQIIVAHSAVHVMRSH